MTYNTSQINLFSKCLVVIVQLANKKSNFYKKKLMKGRFYKSGGGGFSLFFPSKVCSFSPQIMKLRKIAGAGIGKVHHIYRTTQHTVTLHQWCSATSMPFHKCPINLAQLRHSSNSSVKITRKPLPGC